MDPLILSAQFDDPTQQWFNQLRERHFPPERNYLAAHLTLFHHLPGDQLAAVRAHVAAACLSVPGPLAARVTQLMMLGRGVAYRVQSVELPDVRGRIAEPFAESLTPQDRQPFRPHVTVQNKVTAEEARQTHRLLGADFAPFDCQITHLALWHYRGGPWELAEQFPLGTAHASDRRSD